MGRSGGKTVKQAGSLLPEGPEGSKGDASKNRTKPCLIGAGKIEALSVRQRRWQSLFKLRKPLRTTGLERWIVGRGERGRNASHIQIISRSLLHSVV